MHPSLLFMVSQNDQQLIYVLQFLVKATQSLYIYQSYMSTQIVINLQQFGDRFSLWVSLSDAKMVSDQSSCCLSFTLLLRICNREEGENRKQKERKKEKEKKRGQ